MILIPDSYEMDEDSDGVGTLVVPKSILTEDAVGSLAQYDGRRWTIASSAPVELTDDVELTMELAT